MQAMTIAWFVVGCFVGGVVGWLLMNSRMQSVQAFAATQQATREAEAARLREAGLSNRMIARELGVHPSTVGRWLPAAIESVGGDSPSAVADEQGALSTR